MLSQFKMFQNISYLPAFTYIILTALFPFWDVISAGLIANSLVIWILVKILRLYDQTQPKTLEFNIGLIVGASILLYEPIAILIPVVLFALAIIRPFRLPEWLVLLMGILLPFYFVFAFVFLTNQANHFAQFLPRLDWENPLEAGKRDYLSVLKVLGILNKVGKMKTYNLDAEVKFEYSNASFHTAQLFVNNFEIRDNNLIIKLVSEKTKCKAIDICCAPEKVEVVTQDEPCCNPDGNCC